MLIFNNWDSAISFMVTPQPIDLLNIFFTGPGGF